MRSWKKIFGWALAVVVVVAAIGGYFYLRSGAFKQLALRKIGEAADQATGGKTTVRDLDFSLSGLTANLYDITVRGNESADQPPLLRADKLTVGVKIRSLWHRQFNLSELVIEHPVVNVRMDAAGNSNLPTPPPTQSTSHTSVFDLAVQHAQVIRGEVTYNDKKTPLYADLYDLGTDIHFDSAETRYGGSISYDRGQLKYGQYAPLPHSFSAQFSATPAVLSIESATAKIGNSSVALHATLSDYNNPNISGEYSVSVDTHDFAAMAAAYKPAGDISLSGKIHYQNVPNQPLLRNVTVDGEITSDALSAIASGSRIAIRKLHGSYQLVNGDLQAKNVQLDSLGGRLNADLTVRNLDSTPQGSFRASVRNVSLRAAQQTFGAELKQVSVSGTLTGTAAGSWTGSVGNLRARSDLTISAGARNPANASAKEIPVDGIIHATYDGERNIVALRQSSVRIPSATVTADGEISDHSNLRVQASASDLHQLESLAVAFQSGKSALPPVSGSANLNATIRGSLKQPQIAGQFSAQNVNVQGSEWRSVSANAMASPSQVAITNGALVSANRGRAALSATVALKDWAYLPANAVKADLSLQQMPISEIERVANLQYPVSGDLNVSVSLTGSQLDPQGSGKLEISKGSAYDEPIQTFNAQFHTEHSTIISSLRVAVPAGVANADLSYTPKTKVYSVRLDAPAIILGKLHTLQAKNLPMTGTLTAKVSGQGTLDNPQLSAELSLPQLAMNDKSISDIKANLNVANQKADLSLNSTVAQSSVQAHGQVNLTGDYYTEASIQTTAVPLDVLLATYLPSVPQGFKGETELHATLKGPLKDKTKLEAHLTIPKLDASYQSLQIGLAAPLKADYANSVLTVQPTELRGTGTSLRVQGSVPFAGNATPSLAAQGSLDVQIIKIFSPDTQSSGTVAFDVHASGSAQNPSVTGQVRLQDVSLLMAGAPVGVQKLNGNLDIDEKSVQLSNLTGQVGGGNVSVGGSIAYRPSLQANVAVQAKSVRLLYPDGVRTLLDGNLSLSGNQQSSTLSGRVLIDSLAFTPDFDLATFSDQFSSNAATPAQPGFADTVNLSIGVQSKDNLSANSSQISLEGSVNLQVVGTAANPIITGRTDLTSGELFYRNVRYQLQRGIISFNDPTETNPTLNVSVGTTVEQYNLTINLRGPFDKLTTSYVSDPPLSTADVINLIARGQTTEESAASSQSTDSMIASQAVSQVAGGLQKLVGISSLSISPGIGTNNQNPAATVAIQQRVTKNFLFTFSTDVSQPGSEVVQGDYQINKRWSVSATRDQVGGIAVDGRLHTRF